MKPGNVRSVYRLTELYMDTFATQYRPSIENEHKIPYWDTYLDMERRMQTLRREAVGFVWLCYALKPKPEALSQVSRRLVQASFGVTKLQ